MAILFLTGFDYYDQTQAQRVWYAVSGGNSLVPGRFGGRGYYFNNESGYLSTVISNSTVITVGMAMWYAYGDATNPFLVFQDATASRTSPITQVDIRLKDDCSFEVTRNGTIIATSPHPYVFTTNAWNYLETQIQISNNSGYVILRLNGQVILNAQSLDTQTSGNNYANMIRFQPHSSTGQYMYKLDDIYIVNDQGDLPQNNFLGECRIQTQWPTSNGETNAFTPMGAASNWQAVDETIADDDLTYVRSGTVGAIDDYRMGTVSLTGTIFGVQLNLTCRKDDVGSRTIVPLVKSGGTYYSGTSSSCQSDYTVTSNIWPNEPHSSSAWTNTSINAMYSGIKIIG